MLDYICNFISFKTVIIENIIAEIVWHILIVHIFLTVNLFFYRQVIITVLHIFVNIYFDFCHFLLFYLSIYIYVDKDA